MTRSLLTVLTI